MQPKLPAGRIHSQRPEQRGRFRMRPRAKRHANARVRGHDVPVGCHGDRQAAPARPIHGDGQSVPLAIDAERRHVLGNLSCRHVDFLLCEPYTLKPLLVIELDDHSHLKPEAQAADRFKDAVFAGAGLPLLRLDRPNYSASQLRDQIAAKLESVKTGS